MIKSYKNVSEVIEAINAQFDARCAYEASKDAKDSMMLRLKTQRESMTHNVIAEMIATYQIDVAFINRAEKKNARMNVYAIDKIVNLLRCAAKVDALNHYTRAILLTAKKFQENALLMTQDDAMLACNYDAKSKDKTREKLIVRYANVVAANTASTQASSSLNTLKECNLLSESKSAANDTQFKIDFDSALTKRLLETLNA